MKQILFLVFTCLWITSSQAQTIESSSLDAFTSSLVNDYHIAGASVLVVQQGKVLLKKGYGMADLSFQVPTKPETQYFLVGPGGFILSACILQLIEQGKINLDDEASKYLPDYPWQSRRVLIRHLMNSTSGVMDYHYLGDPLESTYRTPKAADEVVGLFAGRGYTSNAPGIKWDWSISNFALLVEILEKVTGSSYKTYLEKNIIKPLALKETHYIEEKQLLTEFARGYGKQNGELFPTYQSLLTYDPSLRISISTGDLFKIWDGIRSGKLITPKSFAMMTTPEGAGKSISPADPTLDFGYILRIRKVGDQVVMGLHGALPGYSSHCYYYVQKDLTIVVLANTSNQFANEIGQSIGLKLLDLPVPPVRPEVKISLENLPMSSDERKSLGGTYRLTLAKDNLRHDSYALYTRTLRVFVEHEQLKIQELGDSPEALMKQADGTFATWSSPSERISFEIQNGKVVSFHTTTGGKKLSTSVRVGDGDVGTFHGR